MRRENLFYLALGRMIAKLDNMKRAIPFIVFCEGMDVPTVAGVIFDNERPQRYVLY